MAKFVDSGISENDYNHSETYTGPRIEVSVIDNIEVIENGTKLSVASKKLIFEAGKYVTSERIPTVEIPIK